MVTHLPNKAVVTPYPLALADKSLANLCACSFLIICIFCSDILPSFGGSVKCGASLGLREGHTSSPGNGRWTISDKKTQNTVLIIVVISHDKWLPSLLFCTYTYNMSVIVTLACV